MKILGIETSCDETSASLIEGKEKTKVKLLSNVTLSSLALHKKTGGIIPEIAAREQLKYILPVIEKSLKDAKTKIEDIDFLAVTIGPGLIGSLLVGIETAKTISLIYKKPIIPVNHLLGHIFANFIDINKKNNNITFPAIVLIVSGGHTDLVLLKNYKSFKWLGGTRDDAAGEAFDKIARLLNLSYPGGIEIEKRAKLGNPKAYNLPRPMINSNDFDFSFSGLKTAVLNKIRKIKKLDEKIINDLSASSQQAIIDVLIKKTLNASKKYKAKSILLSGGVSANQKLRDEFNKKVKIIAPEKFLCTDNAAMIATTAFFNNKIIPLEKITANPELYFC